MSNPMSVHRIGSVLIMVCFMVAAGLPVCSGPRQAQPGRELVFPQDHGKHPNFLTEWWYFTGNVTTDDGRSIGYQLTFFRRSVQSQAQPRASEWAVRDIYMAHFAITDIKAGEFFHSELISRKGPGLAGAADDNLHVFIKDWSARKSGDRIVLRARSGDKVLSLDLTPLKPVVLHGDNGYSRKGDREGQASHYYSYTRLKTQGTIQHGDRSYKVSGLSWMDHEFGSSILFKDQAGWDWISLQMNDGTELMVFRLRKTDGSPETPFGTFVSAQGKVRDLHGARIDIIPVGYWISPVSDARYPTAWNLEIPSLNLSLKVTAALDQQELITKGSTRVVYWEGAVTATGSRGGDHVKGRGYVELTGYAHSMGGTL